MRDGRVPGISGVPVFIWDVRGPVGEVAPEIPVSEGRGGAVGVVRFELLSEGRGGAVGVWVLEREGRADFKLAGEKGRVWGEGAPDDPGLAEGVTGTDIWRRNGCGSWDCCWSPGFVGVDVVVVVVVVVVLGGGAVTRGALGGGFFWVFFGLVRLSLWNPHQLNPIDS